MSASLIGAWYAPASASIRQPVWVFDRSPTTRRSEGLLRPAHQPRSAPNRNESAVNCGACPVLRRHPRDDRKRHRNDGAERRSGIDVWWRKRAAAGFLELSTADTTRNRSSASPCLAHAPRWQYCVRFEVAIKPVPLSEVERVWSSDTYVPRVVFTVGAQRR
jgi:hypothetical protein